MGYYGRANETQIDDAKACPNGSGTIMGYRIEARLNSFEPKKVCGVALDKRWREVPIYEARNGQGVPEPFFTQWGLKAAGLVSRAEAEALRWTFICGVEAQDAVGAVCLETRIVEFKVTYNYSAKPVRYVDAFDMRGEMPDDMVEAPAEETST